MGELLPEYTPQFLRDVKRFRRKHADLDLLKDVVELILANNVDSLGELRRRHRMHTLTGKHWGGARECHVANLGDWLLVWRVDTDVARLLRTGSHDEIFR